MAVTRKSRSRTERKVSLSRNKDTPKVARNTRKIVKISDAPRKLYKNVGASFSVIVGGCLWALAIAGVSVSLLYAYRILTTTAYFSLKYVEIQGNSRLTSREILENVNLAEGANTLALSIADVENKLASNPWIKEISVKRVLPDRLVIGIQEREPAFMVLLQKGMYYADEKGSLIAPVSSVKFTPLPTLEVEKGAEEATGHLPDLIRHIREASLPLGGRNITFVRLSASRGVELFAEDGRLKMSIGLEEWLANLERLRLTLEDLHRRKEFQLVREIKAHGSNVWVEKG